MDTNFTDLNILLNEIRDRRSKGYFEEAIKAYNAGALRPSLVSAWVALVYDLIQKCRELSKHGNEAAAKSIEKWDQANARPKRDPRELYELELSFVADALKAMHPLDRKLIKRFREDRHLCAHPTFSSNEQELFGPSWAQVRTHIENAIEIVLSQKPLQGRKSILDRFCADIQSKDFPTKHEEILDYVDRHYLKHTHRLDIQDFGTELAKSLLHDGQKSRESQCKIISSLAAVRERANKEWELISNKIVRLIGELNSENQLRLITFLTSFPNLFPLLELSMKTALQETIKNTDPAELLEDPRLLASITQSEFLESWRCVIKRFNRDQLEKAITEKKLPLLDLWPRAIKLYKESGSFDESHHNFPTLILPFAGHLSREKHNQLLEAVINNDQNSEAYLTGYYLCCMLSSVPSDKLPSLKKINCLYKKVRKIPKEENREKYNGLFNLLEKERDGWNWKRPRGQDGNE